MAAGHKYQFQHLKKSNLITWIWWPTTALYLLLNCANAIKGVDFSSFAAYFSTVWDYLLLHPYRTQLNVKHFLTSFSIISRGGTAKDDELTSAQLRARHAIPGNSRGKLVVTETMSSDLQVDLTTTIYWKYFSNKTCRVLNIEERNGLYWLSCRNHYSRRLRFNCGLIFDPSA